MWGGHAWRMRGVRAYNGGLGSEPPAISRSTAPGQRVRGGGGQSPLSLKPFSFWCPTKQQICFILRIYLTDPIPSSRVKIHRICINCRNDLWQKWGGHIPQSTVATPLSLIRSLAPLFQQNFPRYWKTMLVNDCIVGRTLYFTDWGATPSVSAVAVNSSSASRRLLVVDDISWPNGLSLDLQGKSYDVQLCLV